MNRNRKDKTGLAGNAESGRYLIHTFGCQLNQHDSEILAGILESLGYSPAAELKEADLVLINTCAVREKPEQKVAALLGKLKAMKETSGNLTIAVGGCMAQQEHAAEYIRKRFPFVDLVFGTHSLPRLPLLLERARREHRTVVDIEEHREIGRTGLPIRRSSNFQAWVPVIYGCNNYCSYCVVPYVRGRERSRQSAEIIDEVSRLAGQGYLEVTLLGQNVNSYGLDLPGQYDFASLLSDLNQVEGLERIRFMTSHPKDLSDRLIEAVAGGEKICEHFHLPVQSGSNRVLAAMNRRYTREQYLSLVRKIKSAIPGVAITTDIIVGFPGEAEDDFQQTLDLLQQARFDGAFIFNYSHRRGTAAAGLPDHLSRTEKNERLIRANELQNRISLEINRTLIGRRVSVLVEGRSKSNLAMVTGRTRTNKLVHFPGDPGMAGKLVEVAVTGAQTWNLTGELTD